MNAFTDLGYEGNNVVFLHRYAADEPMRHRELAKDLVDSKANVIITET
jgi:putative tryptophan/tyrosine transport system substrate-binding protein